MLEIHDIVHLDVHVLYMYMCIRMLCTAVQQVCVMQMIICELHAHEVFLNMKT